MSTTFSRDRCAEQLAIMAAHLCPGEQWGQSCRTIADPWVTFGEWDEPTRLPGEHSLLADDNLKYKQQYKYGK